MKSLRLFALLVNAVLVPVAAAQSVKHAWNSRATFYMLGAGMNGSLTARGVTADVDASFSDIWSNLEFGAMVNLRSESQRYALGFDAVYVALGAAGAAQRTVDLDQWIVEFSGSYRLSSSFEVFAAARYIGLSTTITTAGTGGGSVKRSVDWGDPIVGARLMLPLSQRWSLVARGDVGGFGVGSESTWQAIAALQYATSETFSIVAGYRILDIDYESGEGTSLFAYDMTIAGPAVGLSWRF